jgi:hypothetical protein
LQRINHDHGAVLSFYCCSADALERVDSCGEGRGTGSGLSGRVSLSALRAGLVS